MCIASMGGAAAASTTTGPSGAAYDDRELAFVVELRGYRRRDDWLAGGDQAAGELAEEHDVFRARELALLDVSLVVQADTHDLARPSHRGRQPRICTGDTGHGARVDAAQLGDHLLAAPQQLAGVSHSSQSWSAARGGQSIDRDVAAVDLEVERARVAVGPVQRSQSHRLHSFRITGTCSRERARCRERERPSSHLTTSLAIAEAQLPPGASAVLTSPAGRLRMTPIVRAAAPIVGKSDI